MNPDSLFCKAVNGELPLPNAAKLLGWKFIKYEEQENKVHIEFNASTSLTNPMGNVQGGMLSAMLDDCMGPAIYATLPADKVAVTVHAQTQFLRPAKPGLILGWGRIDSTTSRVCFTSGQLTNDAGEVLATATGIYQIVNWLKVDS